jgi:dolichol-phosphate mannosyltransferase
MMRKAIIILPIYNEAQSLLLLFKKIEDVKKTLAERVIIVAVDDGSRDSSPGIIAEAAKETEIVCINHTSNEGLGKTMQDGYQRGVLIAGDDDLIVTMDGDNTHDPRYIKSMLDKFDQGFDIIIASRYQKGSSVKGVPWKRKPLSFGANLFCRVFLHIENVKDYACGFRAFRARLIKDCIAHYGENFLRIGGFGFICTVEALVKAAARGARIAEVPFELRYDLKAGKSKMKIGRTITGYLLLILESWLMKREMQRR